VQKKVFVVSLHRSATQSTDLFLRNAGLNTCHYPSIVDGICYELNCLGLETAPQRIVGLLRPVFDAFDAVSDLPIPAIYEELDAAYPDAKFVAVYRDPSDWVRSVRQHSRSRDLWIYERVLFWRYLHNKPITLDQVPDDVLASVHRLHHAGLATHFNDRNNLLIVDVADSNIGPKLSSFLDTPSLDFPWFDYKFLPGSKHSPDYFRVLGKEFEQEIIERERVIGDLYREIEQLRRAYRFSLARIQNKLRRLVGSSGATRNNYQ
jgi:Sulfotransferase domain